MDILLVDDDLAYAETMWEALHHRGYTIYRAADGWEACRVLGDVAVDVIISDIHMPNMNGLKLHAWVRGNQHIANTKFIFLTSYANDFIDALHLDPLRDFVLEKTMTPDQVVRFVDRLVFGTFAEVWR
ncbi:MAG: hypothetical protein C4326_01920 [Ignavibacteria bacterium]